MSAADLVKAGIVAAAAEYGLPPAITAAIVDKIVAYTLDELDAAQAAHLQAEACVIVDKRPLVQT